MKQKHFWIFTILIGILFAFLFLFPFDKKSTAYLLTYVGMAGLLGLYYQINRYAISNIGIVKFLLLNLVPFITFVVSLYYILPENFVTSFSYMYVIEKMSLLLFGMLGLVIFFQFLLQLWFKNIED